MCVSFAVDLRSLCFRFAFHLRSVCSRFAILFAYVVFNLMCFWFEGFNVSSVNQAVQTLVQTVRTGAHCPGIKKALDSRVCEFVEKN